MMGLKGSNHLCCLDRYGSPPNRELQHSTDRALLIQSAFDRALLFLADRLIQPVEQVGSSLITGSITGSISF